MDLLGLFAIYSITTVSIIGVVISENRNPVKIVGVDYNICCSSLWLGIILYVFSRAFDKEYPDDITPQPPPLKEG